MAFQTPVLLLVFNRPEHTLKVLDRLRQVKPTRLYVSADGPRANRPEEAGVCQAVREIIAGIDWPCTLQTRYLDQNLGCRDAVRSGIDWFFQQEEEGIILEDDCLPDLSFFQYCEELLAFYREESAVMHISGNNPAASAFQNTNSSYVFSRYALIWGWATWRRAWQQYRADFKGLEEAWADPESSLHQLDHNPVANRYMLDKFRRVRDGLINTWDYAWFYTILIEGGLCIVPVINMVENIGFDAAATHTGSSWGRKPKTAQKMQFPLVHPAFRSPDSRLEAYLFRTSQKNRWGLLLRKLLPERFFHHPQ